MTNTVIMEDIRNALPFRDLTSYEIRQMHTKFDYLDDDSFVKDLKKPCSAEVVDDIGFRYCTESDFNDTHRCVKKPLDLSIFHMNIRSLNANQRGLIQVLCNLDLKFDIIVLSETGCTNINFYQNIFRGYTLFFDLPINTDVGGVGVFVNYDISAKLLPEYSLNNTGMIHLEILWLELVKNKRHYVLGGIYRHPNKSITDFGTTLNTTLEKIATKNISCIITGDINIDLLKYDCHCPTFDYVNDLLAKDFFPTI